MLGNGVADRARQRALAVAAAVLMLAGLVAVGAHRAPTDPTVEASRPDLPGRGQSDVDASSDGEPTTPVSRPTDSAASGTADRSATDTSGGNRDPRLDGTEPAPPPSPPTADEPAATRARTIDLDGAPAPVSLESGVPGGAYLLTATVSATSERVQVTVGGERGGDFFVDGTRQLTVPVHVRGPSDTVGVRAGGEEQGEHGSIQVSRLALEPSSPGYTTRGAAIIDAGGTAVVERGVNRTGLNASATPQNLTRSDFTAMRDAGVEIVRLKLGQHLWLRDFCDHDPAYPDAVDRAVDSITSLGLVALLDLAWTTGGDRCGEPGLQPMPDTHSVAFWRQVAARYQANPLVAFNIFNEPGDVSRTMWRDGGTVTEQTGLLSGREWQAVGMQDLYDTVRTTGARNLVYVSGPSYSADLRAAESHPLDGYGLVYGAHVYCHDCNHLPPIMSFGIEPIIGNYPVTITEFGTMHPSGTFNQRVIDWAEERGIGWQAFMWLPRQLGAYGLLDSWETYDPSPVGEPVLGALRRPYGR